MFLSGPSAAQRGAKPELLVHTISFKGNSAFTVTELAKVIASNNFVRGTYSSRHVRNIIRLPAIQCLRPKKEAS